MEFTRRELVRIAGYSALFSLLPLGMQSVVQTKIEKDEVPGSGNLKPEEIEKIDVDAYLASCSRCGVCVSVCPQQAIKLSSLLLPILTADTRDRCPSTFECSVCMSYCPTNAIRNAYDDLGFENTALYKRNQRLAEISNSQ